MKIRLARLAGFAVLGVTLSLAAAAEAAAQIHACYVEKTGVIYRIDPDGLLDLPTECVKPDKHIQFSWVDAEGADHSSLTGLAADDHPQYLLADGSRALSADLSAGGHKLTGLAEATAAGEAVRYEQAVKDGDAAGGDLGGTYPDPTVIKLQGKDVSSATPADGEVLSWDGNASEWVPTLSGVGVSPWAGYEVVTGEGFFTDLNEGQVKVMGARVDCPEEKVAINGGYSFSGDFGYGVVVEAAAEFPRMRGVSGSSTNGWSVNLRVRNTYGGPGQTVAIYVKAICVDGPS